MIATNQLAWEFYRTLTKARKDACNEIRDRHEAGESYVDLYVEYYNESQLKQRPDRALDADDAMIERLSFLKAALEECGHHLAHERISQQGWVKERFGKFVSRYIKPDKLDGRKDDHVSAKDDEDWEAWYN